MALEPLSLSLSQRITVLMDRLANEAICYSNVPPENSFKFAPAREIERGNASTASGLSFAFQGSRRSKYRAYADRLSSLPLVYPSYRAARRSVEEEIEPSYLYDDYFFAEGPARRNRIWPKVFARREMRFFCPRCSLRRLLFFFFFFFFVFGI